MKVLVTGASGFVGPAACRALIAAGHRVAAAVRRPESAPAGTEARPIGDLGPECDWSAALAGMDSVVHLAARAHVMNDRASDPLALFRHINRDGTIRLAEQAAAAGISRFVFVSTIKVNGEATFDRPFRPDDCPAPQDPYGIAKAEAEAALAAIAARTGMEYVVVRPPLMHGPGAKGNLATLLRVLGRGIPLPLGAIRNRRHLLGIDNLGHLLALCLGHPDAAGRVLLACDGEAVSTPELLRRLGDALGRPARLLPVPPSWLRAAAALLGRGAAVDRLTQSLEVDDSITRQTLGWTPPLSLDAGLRLMAGR
ncbi:NAD-dependent epimerase/dehydratase family protein [Magnetospirillum sp. 15-1]|uniref:NAD-dependent epimerase/dehydratase family protein n=1 Tax=Magnetospirillum sp. 15-1 TaxID=1979370 RepID=UPI000BBBBB11|nr:NAD-dependent epimerase/dehydratase family protein [Magnetospirillum sp. 15-1]